MTVRQLTCNDRGEGDLKRRLRKMIKGASNSTARGEVINIHVFSVGKPHSTQLNKMNNNPGNKIVIRKVVKFIGLILPRVVTDKLTTPNKNRPVTFYHYIDFL